MICGWLYLEAYWNQFVGDKTTPYISIVSWYLKQGVFLNQVYIGLTFTHKNSIFYRLQKFLLKVLYTLWRRFFGCISSCFLGDNTAREAVTSDITIADHSYIQFKIRMGCQDTASCYGNQYFVCIGGSMTHLLSHRYNLNQEWMSLQICFTVNFLVF